MEAPSEMAVAVNESPKSKRARATMYTASTPERHVGEKHRQRHMTWTQVGSMASLVDATRAQNLNASVKEASP